jgi:hypothetical protein
MQKIILIGFLLLAGCYQSRNFYTHTSGEQSLIGLKIPVSSENSFDVVSHLNGQNISVKDKSNIYHQYEISYSNNFFNVIQINELIKGII